MRCCRGQASIEYLGVVALVALVLGGLAAPALAGADLTGASFGRTVITGCLELDRAVGLTTINHAAPSALDVVTFERLRGKLPSAFVAGLGIKPD